MEGKYRGQIYPNGTADEGVEGGVRVSLSEFRSSSVGNVKGKTLIGHEALHSHYGSPSLHHDSHPALTATATFHTLPLKMVTTLRCAQTQQNFNTQRR